MNRLKKASASLLLALAALSCASYGAYQKARTAEKTNDWDQAVTYYEKALEIDPENIGFKMAIQHARLEASRAHFEKGKTLQAAALTSRPPEQIRLAELAATELQLTIRLDPSNQYAAIEMAKVVQLINDINRTADHDSIDEVKKRAKNITKTQPPQLNPASDAPISLSFPRETPVKDIYRALGNAFGINILFDQAVKDDRISIELKDVTAQQALERVMQAANHFYKVLDEHTIIVVPDNPQARRDYEDLVIQTFYLSNGDAEQVTNVVRTMIEARNVFPLKALNAITIRDTADKVKIAEKIIEANDKAKAEVVVDVELLQLDINKARTIGAQLLNAGGSTFGAITGAYIGPDGKPVTSLTWDQIRDLSQQGPDPGLDPKVDPSGRANGLRPTPALLNFAIPSFAYNFVKSASGSELLANPELRISEGEKATLHIGSRVPVPVSTFNSISTGTTTGAVAPVTSYQYQDVGIKVSIEPRVHHNREVTLKLTVEVSNLAGTAPGSSPPQPIISTRTIESTIRLKDGETNFLAGLIQHTDNTTNTKIPILGDIPILGRLFTNEDKQKSSTDLVLTMTPHIIRIPDVTEDDMAPMWVGTTNNLTFRGVSPRIESQSGVDPFTPPPPRSSRSSGAAREQFLPGATTTYPTNRPLAPDGEPGNYMGPEGTGQQPAPPTTTPPAPVGGSGPNSPFNKPPTQPQPPVTPNPPNPEVRATPQSNVVIPPATATVLAVTTEAATPADDSSGAARLAPRIGAQPATLAIKPGEEKIWNVVGMDLEGLTAGELLIHFDPHALDVAEVMLGPALGVDLKTPPVATINRDAGTVRIASADGKPLVFVSGGVVAMLRVHGGLSGDTFLVLENPNLRNVRGEVVVSAIAGGRAKVE